MRYTITELATLPPIACPCGTARRGFVDAPDAPASKHLVEIDEEAITHFHRKTTEIYYFLTGEGEMELDGQRHAVRPGMAVMILPGCRHRAVGRFRILNIAIPRFDPSDEFTDETDPCPDTHRT